jgi:ATP-dependent Clp protease protease subunit
MRNKLMAFYRANAGKGQGFTVRADGGEPELLVYDYLVSSDDAAYWMGGVSAETFARTLATMDAPRIHIRINSPGGDAFAGIAMANAIRAYRGEVVVHVDGYAASAAGHLTAAAARVVMGLGSMIMVHKGWTFAMGNEDDFRAAADVLGKLDVSQARLFAEKNPEYDWAGAMAAETWFDADEAIAIGLASELADTRPNGARALAFDLSAFDKAPAAPIAPAPPEPTPPADDTAARAAAASRARFAQALALTS